MYWGCTLGAALVSSKTKLFQRVTTHRVQDKTQDKHFSHSSRHVILKSWCGHAEQCVNRYCELAKQSTAQLKQVETPGIDDHQSGPEDQAIVGELAPDVCAHVFFETLVWWQELVGKVFLRSVNKYSGTSSDRVDHSLRQTIRENDP